MTIQQFYDELLKHDWYHHNADDQTAYQRGQREYKRLCKIAKIGGDSYEKLMDQVMDHFYSGNAFSKTQAPLPKKPELI